MDWVCRDRVRKAHSFFLLLPLRILSASDIDAALPRGLRVFCLPQVVPGTIGIY